MYYPIGWHKVLKLDTQCGQEKCTIISVQACHEKSLFLILTTRSLHIWCPMPAVEILCHRRSQESIDNDGINKSAVWKRFSHRIVVLTDRDRLLFYDLPRPNSGSHDSDQAIYRIRHDSLKVKNILNNELRHGSSPLSLSSDNVPALNLAYLGKLDLSSFGVTYMLPADEEVIVGARDGNIYGVRWNGNFDVSFPWSLPKEVRNNSDYVVNIQFSSVLSGFTLIFNSGRVGFMSLDNNKGERRTENSDGSKTNSELNRKSQLNYSSDIDDAILSEVNHKYRLVAIGLKSSKVVVCDIDEIKSSLLINHRLELQVSKIPHDPKQLGPISCMRYSPDSFALAVSWTGGHLAIWSVFGSLLFCTQQWQQDQPQISSSYIFNSFSWGQEGYHIWLNASRLATDDKLVTASTSSTSEIDIPDNESSNPSDSLSLDFRIHQSGEVLIMSLAHSALIASPHLACSSDAIILVSQDKLFVGPSIPNGEKFDHWFTIDIPQQYLEFNWPIRFATVDRDCSKLAIAGDYAFAVYSIESRVWYYHNQKAQGDNFGVCGDIVWWNEYLLLSCVNFNNDNFEIRAYLISDSGINDNCIIQNTNIAVVRFSVFENRMLVLYNDGTLGMFMLNLRMTSMPSKSKQNHNSIAHDSKKSHFHKESPRSSKSEFPINSKNLFRREFLPNKFCLQISPIENLVISNLRANPLCISSIALTKLHFKNNRHDDSILLNACGKLFLLEREVTSNLSPPSPTSDLSSADLNDLSLDSQKSKELDLKVQSAKRLSNSIHFASASLDSIDLNALSNVTFKAVSVIATNVEQFWISPEISNALEMSFFRKSLWLYCGGSNNYLQVWLPLLNDKGDPPTDLYVPDRIMLPIRCDIYPLAIRSSAPDMIEPDDAIVLGAESEILYRDNELFKYFPYSTVKRQCRVYLHRILRELLLNQHLGYYARKIAESSQSLPYFRHCFELLLHEVLEEESTSPVPLPDPMLPQVVKFIREFTVYHETVVHCARKSELSMWSHLFDDRAVGNPRRLFQECLEKHKLDVAASCLIILQSLDRNIVSQRMVRDLIKAAKDDEKFNYLVEDLENFISRAELDCINLSASGSPNP